MDALLKCTIVRAIDRSAYRLKAKTDKRKTIFRVCKEISV